MSNTRIYEQPNSPIATTKATVISIVPFDIVELKPGLIPGEFFIPASQDDEPVCLVVDQSLHYVYIDHDRGSMRVLDPSYEVARSIVLDYCNAQLEARPGCHPGIFWKLGEWTPTLVLQKFSAELEDIRRIQNEWFIALTRLADDDWEKTRQHYSISDTQRVAAKKLDPNNTRNRPWIMHNPSELNPTQIEMTLCGACGSDVPKAAVICRYCSFVLDPERYGAMQFASSGSPAKIDYSKVRI